MDISYGIIPFQKVAQQWQVLLVQHNVGHWSFPKGHQEPEEDPKHCASRELYEETGLHIVRFLSEMEFVEHYKFHFGSRLIQKKVTYFLAEVEGKVTAQLEEVQECRWFSITDAMHQLTHQEARSILIQARTHVPDIL